MSLWEDCLPAYWYFLLVHIIGPSCSFSPFTVRRLLSSPFLDTPLHLRTLDIPRPTNSISSVAQPQKIVFLDSALSVYAWKLQCQYHPSFCNELHIISQATLDSRHSIHGNPLKFHMFSFLVFASARQAGTLADHMHLSAHDYPAISDI